MRVAQVWRYPVKSMQGERLDAITIVDGRVRGDREWGVRDSTTGVVLTGRATRPLLHAKARLDGDRGVRVTLPDGRELQDDDENTDLALSWYLGTPVQLARANVTEVGTFEAPIDFADDASTRVQWPSQAGTFNDGHPVHVLTTASLRGGAALHAHGEWDVRRFRPNVLVETEGDDFPEDSWTALRIGSVELEVYKRSTRCAMTARAQPGLDDDLGIPRALARNRQAKIGVYATVKAPGSIEVGAEVHVSMSREA
jgi:uncharacterized protein YcbX